MRCFDGMTAGFYTSAWSLSNTLGNGRSAALLLLLFIYKFFPESEVNINRHMHFIAVTHYRLEIV